MRYVVDEKALSRGRSLRSAEPAALEFANLYAAMGETLKHFDEQIRAAEQELEVLRVLRNPRTVAGGPVLGLHHNDNRRHFMNLAVAEASSLDEDEA